jgi:hypothetical protein
MPFDYSRFLHAVESRARKLRGLLRASDAAAGTSLAALAAMVVVRLLRIPLPDWSLCVFVLLPLVAGTMGYAIGRLYRPRLPHLLLRIDDTLSLNARLSSLYELRQRDTRSIFRERIEGAVAAAVTEWRTAMPVGGRTILGASAGACCIALMIGLAFVPLPAVTGSPLDMVDQTSSFSRDPLFEEGSRVATPMTEATAPLTLRADREADQATGATTLDAPDRDHNLESVMRDLSGLSPDEAVLIPISPDEIERLARQQSEAMRALAQLLESIRDRLENSPPSDPPELTEDELEALEREANRGGLPPEVQEGLNELMNRPQGRSVEEIVEQLMNQFEDAAESEGDSSEDGESGSTRSTAVTPNAQDIEDLLDELGQASSDEEPPSDAGVPAGADEPGGPSGDSDADGDSSSGGQPNLDGKEGAEESDQFGGTAGPGSSSDADEEREPGFLREEERAKIGPEGSFVSEFVTEGVPIEVMPGSHGEGPSFRVSYDQIVSILRERGLPDGAMEIVRDYFNAITKGGP